jgi:hypothetical protein
MSVLLVSLLLASAPAEPSANQEPSEPAKAPAIDLEALGKNSPFGAAPASAGTAKPAPTSTLELRGMYQEGETTYYSLYDTTTKQSRWVAAGEAPSEPAQPVVRSFDAATSTLVVETGGKTLALVMKPASVSKYEPPPQPRAEPAEGGRGGSPLPEPGPDGKVQTPYGSFTPEQIAAFRAERERRWQERMQQMQAEGGNARAGETPGGEAPEGGGRGERGSRRGSR